MIHAGPQTPPGGRRGSDDEGGRQEACPDPVHRELVPVTDGRGPREPSAGWTVGGALGGDASSRSRAPAGGESHGRGRNRHLGGRARGRRPLPGRGVGPRGDGLRLGEGRPAPRFRGQWSGCTSHSTIPPTPRGRKRSRWRSSAGSATRSGISWSRPSGNTAEESATRRNRWPSPSGWAAGDDLADKPPSDESESGQANKEYSDSGWLWNREGRNRSDGVDVRPDA